MEGSLGLKTEGIINELKKTIDEGEESREAFNIVRKKITDPLIDGYLSTVSEYVNGSGKFLDGWSEAKRNLRDAGMI